MDYQSCIITQMLYVEHAGMERLLKMLLNQRTLSPPPEIWHYFTLIYLDQLVLHQFMQRSMD